MAKPPLKIYAVVAGLWAACGALAFAQQDKPVVAHMTQSKFETMPGIPPCATFSVQKGDPAKEGAVILFKMPPGCVVPMHWHSMNESAMIVGGKGRLQMQGQPPQTVTTGDYAFFPAHHKHQFTSVTAITFFAVTDGPFDIHYVDADGKEIAADQALKTSRTPSRK